MVWRTAWKDFTKDTTCALYLTTGGKSRRGEKIGCSRASAIIITAVVSLCSVLLNKTVVVMVVMVVSQCGQVTSSSSSSSPS